MTFIISKLINGAVYTLYKKLDGYILKMDCYPFNKMMSVRKVKKELVFSEDIDSRDLPHVLKMIYPKIKE